MLWANKIKASLITPRVNSEDPDSSRWLLFLHYLNQHIGLLPFSVCDQFALNAVFLHTLLLPIKGWKVPITNMEEGSVESEPAWPKQQTVTSMKTESNHFNIQPLGGGGCFVFCGWEGDRYQPVIGNTSPGRVVRGEVAYDCCCDGRTNRNVWQEEDLTKLHKRCFDVCLHLLGLCSWMNLQNNKSLKSDCSV